jgi:8-oxo-dGTP pyrophosphatase MutT (NUDIX family)
MKHTEAQPQQKIQVWVCFQSKYFLLLKLVPKRGEGWHPITGGVEKKDRDLLMAAKREALEETSLTLDDIDHDWIDLNFSFQYEGRFGFATEHAFALLIKGGGTSRQPPFVKIDPKEHTEYEWVRASQVKERIQFPQQLKAFERLLNYV